MRRDLVVKHIEQHSINTTVIEYWCNLVFTLYGAYIISCNNDYTETPTNIFLEDSAVFPTETMIMHSATYVWKNSW